MTNNNPNYQEFKEGVSRDARHALAFFFFGIPAIVIAIIGFFVSPIVTSLVLLAVVGAMHLIKKHGRS